MNDIRPVTPPSKVDQPPATQQVAPEVPAIGANPKAEVPVVPPLAKPRSPRWRLISLWAAGITALVVASSLLWYALAQRPADSSDTSKIIVRIESGATPAQIASTLHQRDLIRSELAFDIYSRLHSVRGELKAGTYKLAPSESLPEIVTHLTNGAEDSFTITFYPGATLYDPTDIDDTKRTDVYTMLSRAGYQDGEIKTALTAQYDHPLMIDKPAGTSLEGYVYGETYQFAADATISEVLEHTFDVYYDALEESNIISGAKKQGLNLYQTITLASIIEREVSNIPADQRQVAQVFYSRLDTDMSLGADATFKYAAQQRNTPATIDIDSPYNTRINKGLPPGPIATPGIGALRAVSNPASGDYMYFVSGDDGKNYFARTESEHIKNTRQYCTDLCQSP